VSCVELTLKFGSLSELTAKTISVLQDSDGGMHGRTEFVGPWPPEVTAQFAELRKSIETHLLAFHFETKGGPTTIEEARAPTGIFGERRRPEPRDDDVDDL